MSAPAVAYTSGTLELAERNQVIYFKDDFPFWGALTNRLSESEADLIRKSNSKVVSDGTTYYYYCEGVASWCQLYSEVAGYALLKVTGINAPVNYATALKWAYSLLKRIALPVSKVYPSVCIGSYRLAFMCRYDEDGPVVVFRPHPPVVSITDKDPMYDRIATFVQSPIILPYPPICPYEVRVSMDDPVINKLFLPLRYDQKLDFLWRIGRAIIDPVRSPSVIVFYGRDGHEGKSELAKNLTRVIPDAVEWVTDDLFGHKAAWPSPDTVMYLCQKRVLVCDECRIEDGFSYNNIKRWTSEAPITMNGRAGYLSQTSIVVSNHIPFFEKSAVNNSIGRRLVIYDMRKKLTSLTPLHRSEITNEVAVKVMSLAISVAHLFVHAPMSLPIALYTMFRKNINKITAGLVYDVAATETECLPATTAMAIRCGVSPKKLCGSFSAMSPRLVGESRTGLTYIKSIRYLNRHLTPHGVERLVAAASTHRETVDLEKLMEKAVTFTMLP